MQRATERKHIRSTVDYVREGRKNNFD